jgi:hypothetical protein
MTHKILIVDDEPNIVMSIEFLLKKEGFVTETAGDGDAALEKVRSFVPDLVLLDVMMPKKSGFEVCEVLRSDTAAHQPRISDRQRPRNGTGQRIGAGRRCLHVKTILHQGSGGQNTRNSCCLKSGRLNRHTWVG